MSSRHRLDDGSTWPSSRRAEEVLDRLLYGEHPDLSAAGFVAAYLHLLTHPAGTEAAVQKLRELRRLERAARR